MNKDEQIRALADVMTKKFAETGLLIEGGWAACRMLLLPTDLTDEQVAQFRTVYFAGVEHLYSSLMNVMSAGTEPTDADMHKMELIHNELMAWRETMLLHVTRPEGSA